MTRTVRNGALAAVGVVAALAAAGTAGAATLALEPSPGGDGNTLAYTGTPGERNSVDIDIQQPGFGSQGPQWTIQELAGYPIVTSPPCKVVDEPMVRPTTLGTCADDDVEHVRILLGDRDDVGETSVMSLTQTPTEMSGGPGGDQLLGSGRADRLFGGDGDDTITGNAGRDILVGGAGDDAINAVDGFVDVVYCGDGEDTVQADVDDRVAADCETVHRQGQGQPGAPPDEPPPVDPGGPPPGVAIEVPVPTGVAAARHGLRLRVRCPGACSARTQLLVPAGPRSPVTPAGKRRAGEGRLTLRHARRGTLHVKLANWARRSLAEGRSLRLIARSWITPRGGFARMIDRRVRIRA